MARFADQPPRPPVRKGIGYQKPSSELPGSGAITQPAKAAKNPEIEKLGSTQKAEGGADPKPTVEGKSARQTASIPGDSPQKVVAAKGKYVGKWKKRSGVQPAVSPSPHSDSVRLDMRERIQERKNARRRLIAYRVAWGLGLVAAIGGLLWLNLFSTLFALDAETIEVQGVQSGELEQRVKEVTSAYAGVPLPRVPTGQIARELSEVPDVAQVEVARSWPSSLLVSIQERTPSAVVSVGKEKLVVGEDGVVLRAAAEEDAALPMIVLGEEDRGSLEENAASAVEVWMSLSPGLSEQVDTIEVKRKRSSLNLVNVVQVVWGESDQGQQKSEVTELLMANREAAVYDVSDPKRPVTR